MELSTSRRRALRLGGVAVAASLAGCPLGESEGQNDERRRVPTDWQPEAGAWVSTYRYDLGGNRYNLHATPPDSEPDLEWEYDYEPTNPYPGFAVADGKLFLRSSSALTALDTENGDELWSEPQDGYGEVFYVDGRLYHTTNAGEEALTLDGEVEWEIDDGSRLVGEMGEYVYAATQEELQWYDSESGDRLGSVEMAADPLGAWRGFVFGSTGDALVAYDHDGEEPSQAWQSTIEGGFELQGNWFTVADGTLHVLERGGAREKRIGRYDVEDGTVETTDRTYDDVQSFVVRDGVEYVGRVERADEGDDGTFHITARGDGVSWERSFDSPSFDPVIADDTVLLNGDDGELLALDAETGDLLWQRSDTAGFLAAVDDTVFVLYNGTVRGLR